MRTVRETAKRHDGVGHNSQGSPQPSVPGPVGAAEATALAHERWAKEGGMILRNWQSGGQCTDWAAQKRPDVVQRVTEAGWAAELQGAPGPPLLGSAYEWPTSAEAVGFQVSELPVQGALVVWQPGVEGADGEAGHVGYVESVSPDGSTFSTSEMNFGEPYVMGYRTLSTQPVVGRTFILPSAAPSGSSSS